MVKSVYIFPQYFPNFSVGFPNFNVLLVFNKSLDSKCRKISSLNEEKVKLLRVNLEGRLNFDFHVNTVLKETSKKYQALARACNFMNKNKRRILINDFITSQFSYCLLVWMFHSSTINNKIKKIQEKA